MNIDTEAMQHARLAELNQVPADDRAAAEALYGQVWSPDDLRRDYEVLGFGAPIVVVRRKSDGISGSLEFQHHPRFYFNFMVDKGQDGVPNG